MIDAIKEISGSFYEWFSRNMIALLFLSGFSALAISFFIRNGFTLPDSAAIAGLIKIIASAIISGGFFAWLTKVAQLRGVFRKELEKVIYSQDHLLVRKDAEKLWASVTRSLHGESFKDIEKKIYSAITKNYLAQDNKTFYYKQAKRRTWISVVDRKKQIVEVETEFSAILVPNTSQKKILRHYKFHIDGNYSELPPPQITCKHVESATGKIIVEQKAKCSDKNPQTFECTLESPVGAEITLRDHVKFQQCLAKDNILAWKAASYVDGFTVEVHFDPADIHLNYSPMGSVQLREVSHQRAGILTIESEDLIFGGHGVLLSLQIKEL